MKRVKQPLQYVISTSELFDKKAVVEANDVSYVSVVAGWNGETGETI